MLEIRGLSKKYNKNTANEIEVFHDFSLCVPRGQSVAILGSNGCGKSTLVNIISGNVSADAGSVILDGEEMTKKREEERSRVIAKVHQDPNLGVCDELSILENMAIADTKGERFTLKKLIDKERIGFYKERLSELKLGLENKLDVKVRYLSGGQRQCLGILMATLKEPKLLLLDEHTAALDPETSRLIHVRTSAFIERMDITTMMITHNVRDALEFCDRTIMLEHGKIVLDSASKDIDQEEIFSTFRGTL